jgi:hypothetical protein
LRHGWWRSSCQEKVFSNSRMGRERVRWGAWGFDSFNRN